MIAAESIVFVVILVAFGWLAHELRVAYEELDS